MKITWELKDIEPGKIVCREESLSKSEIDGWDAKWTYKIGWFAPGNKEREYYPIPKNLSKTEREEYIENNRADFSMICMSDGMISKLKTKAEILAILNSCSYVPAPAEYLYKLVDLCIKCY